MSDRFPAAMSAASSVIILVLACTQPPAVTTTTPAPEPAMQEIDARRPGEIPPRVAGARPVLTDSARRVRDSITAARRDSGEARLLREIAGRENLPAEEVFKNIKIFKGFPAGRVVRIMNQGFSRSLGVSCGFCHSPPKWDLDDKQEKETARLMFAMVGTINRDYIAKVPRDTANPSVMPVQVNCMTCHMGNPKPMGPTR